MSESGTGSYMDWGVIRVCVDCKTYHIPDTFCWDIQPETHSHEAVLDHFSRSANGKVYGLEHTLDGRFEVSAYALAEAAGQLVIATDGMEDLRGQREAVLKALKQMAEVGRTSLGSSR